MRLMKMMDYDFKVANIWQYYVSEIIAYKLCIGYIRYFFIIVHHLHQTHHSSDRRITIQTMNDGRRPRKGGPLMRVLDTDKNGVLSLEETENAIAALKSLDSDGDGNITRYELHQQNDRQNDQGRNTNYERREPQRDNEYNRY
jgi:hypothetical protein